MMNGDKYAVRLAPEQREELQNLIRVGKSSVAEEEDLSVFSHNASL